MKYPIIIFISLLASCTGKRSNTEKTVALELSKAGQVYQWSEREGDAFLRQIRKNYTTPEAWQERAKEIRSQILRATELVPFPEKCLLNPIMGEKRLHDGLPGTECSL